MFGLHSTLAHFIETAFVYISNIPKYIYHEIIRLYIIKTRGSEPAHHTVSILTGRQKTSFSHLCISVIPYPIGTKFAAGLPAS